MATEVGIGFNPTRTTPIMLQYSLGNHLLAKCSMSLIGSICYISQNKRFQCWDSFKLLSSCRTAGKKHQPDNSGRAVFSTCDKTCHLVHQQSAARLFQNRCFINANDRQITAHHQCDSLQSVSLLASKP